MTKKKTENSEKIKLTITMLVSNRIDTIRKCMDSIDPLLKKIPSELIVVDTGSTDGSIDIVREYTDKIIPFVWCNDFAKARNAGLKRARGEWVMYMDDDEWFEDVTEIIDFFDSGEYKNYNRAVYFVRNYGDMEGQSYVDSNAPRMVKRYPETEFRGAIHECITPQRGPSKYFSAYAHHYGYAFASQEEHRKHSHRNIVLVEEELRQNPNDVRVIAQAVQEYLGVRELYKTLELCSKAMELYKQQPQYKVFAGYCYNVSLRVYMRMENWEKAYEWGEKLLAEGAPTSVAYMGTLREMLIVCQRAEKYAEGIICLKRYLEIYDTIKEKSDKEEICLDLSRYFQEKDYEFACMNGLELAVLDKEWELAEVCLLKKNWQAVPLILFPETLDYVMKLWAATEFKQEYADILDCILKSQGFHRQVCGLMEKYAGGDKDTYRKLLHIFGNCRDGSAVGRKYRFLYYASLEQMPSEVSLEEMLKEIWEKTPNPLLWDREMWAAIGRKKISVLQAVRDTAYNWWFTQVRDWLEVSLGRDGGEGDKFCDMEEICHIVCGGDTDDLHMQFMTLKYQEGSIRTKWQTEENILSCLEEHSDKMLQFYSRIYREEVFREEEAALLPPDGAFAVYMKLAVLSSRENKREKYMQYVGKAAKAYPAMKEVCKELLRKEKEDSRNIITDAEQWEFIRLGEQMKYNVQVLLKNGNYETARQIILQLKNLLPEDAELEELWKLAVNKGKA